jgi:hypothetical protein
VSGASATSSDLITKRRAEPTDDLFSILINAEVEGQRMADLRLAADDEVLPLRPANFVSGLESMPMVFTATPSLR